MLFISRFGRFHEDFALKEGTVPLPFSRNRPENQSHNLGKALAEGLGLLKTGSLSLSLSLSPLSLSLISPSLSISLLLPFFLSLSFSLSSLYHSLWRIQWTFSPLFYFNVFHHICSDRNLFLAAKIIKTQLENPPI